MSPEAGGLQGEAGKSRGGFAPKKVRLLKGRTPTRHPESLETHASEAFEVGSPPLSRSLEPSMQKRSGFRSTLSGL